MTTAAEQKQTLRREAFDRRDGLDPAFRERASRAISDRLLALPDLAEILTFGSYWPIRSEVDSKPALEGLVARGQIVGLPQILHPHLSFREWHPGDVLVKGAFGVREPGPDAPEVFPRALLMPLAAFDRQGGRLGYGQGHFDRAVAALTAMHPVLTIGLAFSVQEIDRVPQEEHDRALDFVVTETEVVRSMSRPHPEVRA